MKTHVNSTDKCVQIINKKENIFNDNIAYVENWDFSRANLNNDNRINAITTIASICYQSPKALNSISLYDRLMCESSSLPSSSFEFVPVLLDLGKDLNEVNFSNEDLNIFKYGEIVEDGKYLLTNFRAIIYDFEEYRVDLRDRFNTEEECEIIKNHFIVLKNHIDLPTFGQYVRHRINWQVVSRRYVSAKKMPFEFYISEKMSKVYSSQNRGIINEEFSTDRVIDVCVNHYFKALEDGVKPEEARRIIPQAAYTTAWCAMQPKQLENFLKLRLDSHAQKEIRLVAEAVVDLLKGE